MDSCLKRMARNKINQKLVPTKSLWNCIMRLVYIIYTSGTWRPLFLKSVPVMRRLHCAMRMKKKQRFSRIQMMNQHMSQPCETLPCSSDFHDTLLDPVTFHFDYTPYIIRESRTANAYGGFLVNQKPNDLCIHDSLKHIWILSEFNLSSVSIK